MAIQVKCPQCNHEFMADHALMGQLAKCPKCKGPAPVPKVKAVAVKIEQEPEVFVPATPKQLAYLETLGGYAPPNTSMEEVSRLIKEAQAKQQRPPAGPEKPPEAQT